MEELAKEVACEIKSWMMWQNLDQLTQEVYHFM